MAILYPGGQDTFTTRAAGDTISESHINDVQDAVELLEKRLGITGDEIIVATAKTLFYADTAPANWTIQVMDDKLVFVTKGFAAGGETGGGAHSTGTWTQPDHTLIIAEMPAHTHTMGPIAGNVSNVADVGGAGASARDTGSTGGGGAHNHGTTWRPAAYNYICCSKDAYPTV